MTRAIVAATLALLLIGSIAWRMLNRPSQLDPLWEYELQETLHSVFLRPGGGVVVTTSDRINWLNSAGELEVEHTVAPDSLHCPEEVDGNIYSGTETGKVLAFSTETGDQLWETQVANSICKVVPGGSDAVWVLLGSTWDGFTEVVVLDSSGGEQRRYKLSQPLSTGMPGPVLPNDLLVGDTTTRNSGHRNAELSAFDASGKVIWSTTLGGFGVWDFLPGPEKSIYGVAHQNKVFCVDAATGQERWSFSNPHTPSGSWCWHRIFPMPRGKLLVESEGRLYLLNTGGQSEWELNLGDEEASCLVQTSGDIFAVVPDGPDKRRSLGFWEFLSGYWGEADLAETDSKHLLVHVIAGGGRRNIGQLRGKVNLKGIGPDGELYGWRVDLDSGTSFISRYDP